MTDHERINRLTFVVTVLSFAVTVLLCLAVLR